MLAVTTNKPFVFLRQFMRLASSSSFLFFCVSLIFEGRTKRNRGERRAHKERKEFPSSPSPPSPYGLIAGKETCEMLMSEQDEEVLPRRKTLLAR